MSNDNTPKLSRVTFTGVDKHTNIYRLNELSKEYPFVEWGVLLSYTKQGTGVRYPPLWFLRKGLSIDDFRPNFAAHACGTLARDLIVDNGHAWNFVLHLVENVKRIQLNIGDTPALLLTYTDEIIDNALRHGIDQVIIQTNSLKTIRDYYRCNQEIWRMHSVQRRNKAVLIHDVSGGRGRQGTFEPPFNSDDVGYAGGISPDNVVQKLEEITALGFANSFWIDMESGVRTNERFDLDKCEAVLKLVKPWVNIANA